MLTRVFVLLKCILPPIAAAAVLALPAAAQANQTLSVQKAVFKGVLTGWQTTSWRLNRNDPVSPSDPTTVDKGNETMDFATPAPVTVEISAVRYKPLSIVVTGDPEGAFETRATVVRNNKTTVVINPKCANGQPNVVTVPNTGCGRHDVSDFGLSLEPAKGAKTWVGLSTADVTVLQSFVNTCPAGGPAFPNVLDKYTNQQPILAQLPKNLVFDPKVPRIVTRGGGSYRGTINKARVKAKLRWKLVLVRTH